MGVGEGRHGQGRINTPPLVANRHCFFDVFSDAFSDRLFLRFLDDFGARPFLGYFSDRFTHVSSDFSSGVLVLIFIDFGPPEPQRGVLFVRKRVVLTKALFHERVDMLINFGFILASF